MGNYPDCCCQISEINLEYEKNQNDNINIVVNLTGKFKDKIFQDIGEKDEFFISLVNKIIQKFDKIEENKIITLKEAIKNILENISNEKDKNIYMNSMDNYIKNNYDIKSIVKISEILKLMYSNKDKIEDDIKYFIKTLNLALKGTDIFDQNSFKYFFEKINGIFFGKKEDLKMDNNPQKNIINDQNILIDFEDKNRKKMIKSLTPLIKGYENILNSKDIENIFIIPSEKSKSDSNFSRYTKNSQKQILKMKDEIKQYKETIEKMKKNCYENGKNTNEIEITFTNNKNEDYQFKIKANEEEGIDTIFDKFLSQYPELKNHKDVIKKIKVNGRQIYFDDKETGNFTNS